MREHIALEGVQDWDGVIATFAYPRYEMYGSGAVYDGEAAVRAYFEKSRSAIPDQHGEIIAVAADGDTVLVEFWVIGTHLGQMELAGRTIARSGKAFRVRGASSFEFAFGSPKMLCERAYFDERSILRALGIG